MDKIGSAHHAGPIPSLFISTGYSYKRLNYIYKKLHDSRRAIRE